MYIEPALTKVIFYFMFFNAILILPFTSLAISNPQSLHLYSLLFGIFMVPQQQHAQSYLNERCHSIGRKKYHVPLIRWLETKELYTSPGQRPA